MPQPRDFRVSGFKGACLPMAGLDRLERTAAAGGGNHEKNMDRQDKQDRLVLHPVHPVYRCKTRIGGMDTGRLDLSKDVSRSHSKGVPPLSSNSLSGDQPGRGPRHRPVDHGGALPAGPHPGGHRPHRGHPGPGLGRGRAGLLLCPRGAGSRALPPGLPRPRPAEAAGPLPLCRGDEPLPAQQPADEVPPGPHGRSRQAGLERRPPRDPGAAAEDRGLQPPPGRDPGRRGGGLAHSRTAARKPPRPGGVPSASWKSCCRFPGWAGSCSTAGPAATGTGGPSFSGA